MKRIIAIGCMIIFLSACATKYQPAGFAGGFTETQIDVDVFRISFVGNGATSPDRAEEMALLRAADITLKYGFNHFIMIDSKSRSNISTFTSASHSYTDKKGYTTTYGGGTDTISKPSTTNTIKCFKEKPSMNGLVYDAQFVYASLSKKYIK